GTTALPTRHNALPARPYPGGGCERRASRVTARVACCEPLAQSVEQLPFKLATPGDGMSPSVPACRASAGAAWRTAPCGVSRNQTGLPSVAARPCTAAAQEPPGPDSSRGYSPFGRPSYGALRATRDGCALESRGCAVRVARLPCRWHLHVQLVGDPVEQQHGSADLARAVPVRPPAPRWKGNGDRRRG